MLRIKNIIILFVIFSGQKIFSENNAVSHDLKADIVIFSFNRPMQLYALLQTFNKYVTNFNKICVLYRTSNQNYENGYKEIKHNFPHIEFVKQGTNPRADFKPLLLNCVFGSSVKYIMFAVDDDIVTEHTDICDCTEAIEKFGAFGFYLRVGLNLTSHYPDNGPVIRPPYTEVQNNILKYQFKYGNDAWENPTNLDMTIFRKSDLENFLKNAVYSSPNTLEDRMSILSNKNNYGLCFKKSRKFALALNIVQQDWYCPHENSFSAEDLLNKWNQGLAMNVEQFFQINNDSFIMGYRPTFIQR